MATEPSELTISRFVAAPPSTVWRAWSTPAHLERWWIPAPLECKVVKLDLRPGGGFETKMREGDGPFEPHLDGCFLDVEPDRRLAFTTVMAEGWRPVEPWLAMSALISFEPEAGGTRYLARVLHRNAEERRRHEELGFFEGWGTVIDQLGAYVQTMD